MASPGEQDAVSPAVRVARGRLRPTAWAILAALVLVVAVVAVACAAGLTGPTSITPTRSMVIGTWRSSSGAVLVLRPDGTFTARGVPGNAGESSTLNIPADGSGRWSVGPHSGSVGVTFDYAPSFSLRVQMVLLVERLGSSVVMYYDKGDPDQGVTGQYQFTKVGPQ
jgi:hypothetical protein